MSELADLMTVFGAVDEAVVNDRTRLPAVAALVPEYDQGALGWFDGIKTWTAQAAEAQRRDAGDSDADVVIVGELPDLPEAVGRLAASDVIEGLADRRLLAIALLSRVQSTPASALTGPTPAPVDDSTLADALSPIADLATYSGTVSLEARSQALLDTVRSAPSRSALVRTALAGGLISQSVADQIMAPPTWTVVPSTEAGGPAVAFETRMRVEATPMATIEAILDPTGWTGFTPPWCKMTDLGTTAVGGPMRCLEVIGLDCAALPPPLLLLRTVLDFQRRNLADGSGSVLEYRLSDNQPAYGGDGLVTVDEGSLVVRTLGSAVEVVTTKRVQFRAFSRMLPLEAAGLAWFVWVLGYNSLAQYFIERVAGIDPSNVHIVGSHRRGATGTAPPAGVGHPGHQGHHGRSGHHDRWYAQIDKTADAFEGALGECWRDARASMAALAEGQYGPADYLSDAVTLSGHLARHGTLMVKFWAGVVPGTAPRPDRSATSDQVP